MSHKTQQTLKIRDANCLKLALMDALGLMETEIEIHKVPVEFANYYKTEKYKGHVVIRRAALNRVFGRAYADAGFLIEGDKATLVHDNMDKKLTDSYGRITAHYGKHVALQQARKRGQQVNMVVENGEIRIQVKVR